MFSERLLCSAKDCCVLKKIIVFLNWNCVVFCPYGPPYLGDTSQGIFQNVERTIPGVENHWFGPQSSHLYIAPFTEFLNSLILYFLKPASFSFKTKSNLKCNRGIVSLIEMMVTD